MPYSCKPANAAKSDTRCPDGFSCYGWRQIHRGGYVRWYHSKYYADEFKQWEGLWVYIEISDCFAIGLDVFPGGPPQSSQDEKIYAEMKNGA
jgi:hypothetical protein